MNGYVKFFSHIGELEKDDKSRFLEFENLNNFLEKNPLLSYRELYNSYVKVVLDIGKEVNFIEYTELDFQVKYLIDEIKVPINSVIDFAQLKFGGMKQILKSFLVDKLYIPQDIFKQILENINQKKTGNIIISLKDFNLYSPLEYTIPFNINGDIDKFYKTLKENFEKITKDQKEGFFIGFGISIV